MGNKIIFRTKLSSSGDYDKFEILDSVTNLNEKDIVILQKYAEVFYNSTKPACEDVLELSIGHVLIKGRQNDAYRRKMIEGFIEVKEVIEQASEPPTIDTRAKELFINFLKEMFTLLKERLALKQITDEEKIISLQIEYLINQLENENWNTDEQSLLTYCLEWLKDNPFKENKKTVAIITCLQNII